jgi:hypothetical protein
MDAKTGAKGKKKKEKALPVLILNAPFSISINCHYLGKATLVTAALALVKAY